ncbi:hypothetical protein [Marinovum sp.]|nr:hypothetical protein [Marinovum sp.]
MLFGSAGDRSLRANTSSAETVFAPVERRMETLNALFGLIDGLDLP